MSRPKYVMRRTNSATINVPIMIQTAIGTPNAVPKPIESSRDDVSEVVWPFETRYVMPW